MRIWYLVHVVSQEGVRSLRRWGLPLAHARGVVREHIGRKVAGRIDTLVPPPKAPTWFARMGHWLTLIWGIVFLALSLVAMRFAGGYPTRNT